MSAAALLFVLANVSGQTDHEQLNPVYAQLRTKGIQARLETVTGEPQMLPPPTMQDGLDAKQQAALIEKIGGFARMTRKSQLAPVKIDPPRSKQVTGEFTYREMDFWFVAYGELKVLRDKEFLDQLLSAEEDEEEGEAAGLTAEQLATRGITLKDKDREGFGHAVYNLLRKVRLHATGWSYWSETDESVVAAVIVDPRFWQDKEYPNQWSPLSKGRGQELVAGQSQPFGGAGLYLKFTELKNPRGALFVEGHAVYGEPIAWFRGTNQLGAKLNVVVQNQARNVRRELLRAARQ